MALGVEPWRLALGFGDLQLVIATNPGDLKGVEEAALALDVHPLVLGEVTAYPGVMANYLGQRGVLNNFDNERFSSESQFTGGLDAYRERLLTRGLLKPAE